MKYISRIGVLSIFTVAAVAFMSHGARADEPLGEKVQEGAKDAAVGAKKAGRSVKRKAKKVGREATGKDNVVDDAKDHVEEKSGNLKDEVTK